MDKENSEDYKICPFCAETIKVTATKCKHCKTKLDDPDSFTPPIEVPQAGTTVPKPKGLPVSVVDAERTNEKYLKVGCAALFALMMFSVCASESASSKRRGRDSSVTASSDQRRSTSVDSSTSVLRLGEEGTIATDTFGAVDDESWDAMTSAAVANDTVGIQQLVGKGKVYLLDKGDRFKVIEQGFTSHRVRMLNGTYANQSCWVQHHSLTR